MGGIDSCRFESLLEKGMVNLVKRLNTRCKGELVEEEDNNLLPITSETITERLPPKTKKVANPSLIKAPMKSKAHKDDKSHTTRDTNTISTDLSIPR
jgi:hypothetical protein